MGVTYIRTDRMTMRGEGLSCYVQLKRFGRSFIFQDGSQFDIERCVLYTVVVYRIEDKNDGYY